MPTVPKETIASVIAPVLLHVGRGGRGYSEYWTDIGTAGGSIMWKKLRLGMAVKANTLRAVFYGFCGTATNLPVTGDVSGNPTRVTYGYQLEVLLRRTDGSSPVNFLLTDPKGGPYIQIGDWTKFWTNISTGVSTDGHKPAVTPKITITAPLAHEALPATATFLCKTWAPADATLSTKIPVYQHWAITTDGEGNYTGGAASQNKWFGGGGAAEVDPIDTTSYTTGPNLLLGEPVLANQRSFLVMADSIGEGYSGVPTTTLDNKNYNWQYAPNQATGYAAKALERLGQCYAGFNQGGQKLSQLFPGFTTGTYFLRHNTDFDPVGNLLGDGMAKVICKPRLCL